MTARENAETADLTLEVERLRGELEQAREAGRSQGREDVGKYSRAIGEIEGLLGITGAVPLRQTVQAVRALTEQLAEATGLLEDWETYDPDDQDCEWYDRRDAFLSRAPEQAGGPECPYCVPHLCPEHQPLSDPPAQAAEPVRDLDWAAAQIVAAARAANCSVKYELQALTSDPEPST